VGRRCANSPPRGTRSRNSLCTRRSIASLPDHVSSFALRDSIGLNQHFETLALNNDPRSTAAVFKFIGSGVKHLRTPLFKAQSLDSWWTDRHHQILQGLAQNGVRLTVLFGWQELVSGQPDRIANAEQVMALCENQYQGKIAAFEGPNEPDSGWVNPGADIANWRKWTLEQQVAIRQARDKRPSLREIPIVGPSPTGGIADRQKLGPIDFLVDAVNTHPYPGNQVVTQAFLTQHLTDALPSCPVSQRGLWATETGISTFGDPWPAVTERQQAILTSKLFLSHLKAGIERTFYYDFIDDGQVPSRESTFGWLRYDLSEKPVYKTMQKLIGLCDPSEAAVGPPLDWTGTNLPSDCQSLTASLSGGETLLFLWREAPLGVSPVTAKVKVPGKTHKASYDLIDLSPDCPYDFPEGYEFDVILADNPICFRV
jgi:hypothetical protein